MFLSQQNGDSLMEANLPPRPCGREIAEAYIKKSVVFLRLTISAVPILPRFRELLRTRCFEMGQSAAELFNDTDLLEDGEVMEQEDELVEDEEDFVCDKCRGVFLASRRALHLLKCIVSPAPHHPTLTNQLTTHHSGLSQANCFCSPHHFNCWSHRPKLFP